MKKWFPLAVLVVLIDQAVKFWAMAAPTPWPLIPGVLNFTYAQNTGMAFSLFSDNSWALGLVSAVCIAIGYAALRSYVLGPLSRCAAMLMLGGAVGNMIDRFLRGYVIDMFEPLFINFAVFNVADAAVTTGVFLMMLSLLTRPDEWRKHDKHQ